MGFLLPVLIKPTVPAAPRTEPLVASPPSPDLIESIFYRSIIYSVLLALMRLLFVLDKMFSIGKFGTPALAGPGAAIFLFDDLFLPLGTFEEAAALWEPVVALKAT